MDIVHWNVSSEGGPSFGTAKYENHLYESLPDSVGNCRRIQRRGGSLAGSMPLSWIERYRRYDADLVHATFQTVAPATFFHPPKNFIVTVHDLAPMVYPSEIRDTSLKLQWKISPPALRKADRIIAISEFTKSEITRLMGIESSKIEVVRQGVNHDLYNSCNQAKARERLDLNPDGIYILVVSSALEHKRIDLALPVINKVKETYPEAKILKAGYGQKIKDDGVINTGWVPEKNMPDLYNAADVYFHPSEYEGFGLPILESISCGTPVVAREVASIPEIVEGTCDLLDKDAGVKEISDAIVSQISSPDESRTLIERSHDFSWRRTARETARVYESLLD